MINKKAQEFAIYGVVAFLLIIFTLAAYWYLIAVPYGATKTIKQSIVAKDKLDADLILLNYLRTPVTLEGKELFISDLIRLYFIDKLKYENQLKQETSDIFNSVFNNYKYKITFGSELIAENGFTSADPDYMVIVDSILPLESSGIVEIHLEVNLKT
ncbi:MAG: hypothetical protein KJ623_04325 [Nanoarchaeota archaeon]|nr:hypothetical protein [Nanoarchaeota archaeon]MBU0962620.1 hypothetical protein [Nanoarchaeota archaeon]